VENFRTPLGVHVVLAVRGFDDHGVKTPGILPVAEKK
jgi:hypothetical protein